MCPSYLRIRLPVTDALPRFSDWIGLQELAPPKNVKSSKSVDEACKNGAWRSVVAVYVYESDAWTVFDDLTGHLASFSVDRWRELAGHDELVFAGYNDSVPYGQLIVVQAGRVVREFLDDRQDTRQNVNRGRLAFEESLPINDWIAAASFVDEDEVAHSPDEGLLWLFGPVS
jgi:hypothetical protein